MKENQREKGGKEMRKEKKILAKPRREQGNQGMGRQMLKENKENRFLERG